MKKTVAQIIAGTDAASLLRNAHRDWYREMFQPCVAAGLIERICHSVADFAGPAAQSDDITLTVLAWYPP